jgi:hypothetical protein
MNRAEKIGFWASVACAIHCTIVPIATISFPIIGISLISTEIFEWILLSASMVIGLTSLCFGFRKHKSLRAFSFLTIGFTLIVVARLLHDHNSKIGFHFDYINAMLIIGGILISMSYYINNKLCVKCKTCTDNGCEH